ncbi:MAG: DUF2997 domain-containing protein [Candidatus Riflebacteria bacterium]|nr:DUF2997 domain-containing protein [Candidatus Riflebacteria bacterium]
MSEIQEIEVVIDELGNVKLLVRGVKGQSCLELTSEIEQLLGGQVLERQNTDEFHEVSDLQDDRLSNRF